jgi:ubiquinone biosynthesis protein
MSIFLRQQNAVLCDNFENMGIIQTTRQFGQAIKNVQRLKQIIGVFARHGFSEVLQRMQLSRFLPKRFFPEKNSSQDMATRLRKAFEELGPTFIKLGQLLSTRSDIVPEHFIEEFIQLQDNVQPLDFNVIKELIEKELKSSLDEIFLFFDSTPLAAASIGQVHAAILKNGDKVVVKTQRPEMEKIIETDVSLLAFLASVLEKTVPESRIFNPKMIVEEFFKALSFELDFQVEANNILKISENLADYPLIVIPQVYWDFSTKKILVLQRLEGIPLNNLAQLEEQKINKKEVVLLGAKAFFKTVMIDGLFHGDLHGGNLFVLEGNKLGIIDFGIVGRLSQKSRDQLAFMVLSLMTEDYENLCYEYAELGTASAAIDFNEFQRKIRNALSPYMGLPLSKFNVGRILIEATRIATEFQIKVPGDWMLVFKAIVSIEGMGRTLDPDFDLLAISEDLLKEVFKKQHSLERIVKESTWALRDFAGLFKVLPRQIRWMLRKWARNDFALEVKSLELDALQKKIHVLGKTVSLSLMVSFLVLSSSIALHFDMGFSLVFLGAALLLFFPLSVILLKR